MSMSWLKARDERVGHVTYSNPFIFLGGRGEMREGISQASYDAICMLSGKW